VTLVTVVGGSVAPMTAWLSSEQERALEEDRFRNAARLQEQQQQQAIRVEFFEKVVSPTIEMTPEARLEALRYFSTVLREGDLRKWAEVEYQSLQELVAARREAEARAAEQEAAAAEAGERVGEKLAEFETAPAAPERREKILQEVDRETRLAKEKAEDAQQAKRAVEKVEQKINARLPKPVAKAEPSVADSARQIAARTMVAQRALAPEEVAPARPLRFEFRASQQYLSATESATYYRFTTGIEASDAVLDDIARVDYLFDHPTFRQKKYSSTNAARGFEVSYRGWGCLNKVVATITLVDGRTLERTYDMCALL
jgi:hypothetical protein